MKSETILQNLDSYHNGNISEFKDFLKACSKKDIIELLLMTTQEKTNETLNAIRRYL